MTASSAGRDVRAMINEVSIVCLQVRRCAVQNAGATPRGQEILWRLRRAVEPRIVTCGAENPPRKAFCGDCGTALGTRNAAQSMAASLMPNVAVSAEHSPAALDG